MLKCKKLKGLIVKPILAVLMVLMCGMIFTGCSKDSGKENKESSEESSEDDKKVSAEFNVAVMKGPTAIGFIKAWDDSDEGLTDNKYNVTAYGTADEITAGLIKGEIDIAAVPATVAQALNTRSEGNIKVAAINTLGVLYMISDMEGIDSVSDLKGKTIYTTGKGTTPENVLNYVLEKNGLTPGEDVIIEYKTEATEVAAVMSNMEGAIAMLPQPYVTTVLSKQENMNIVLDMNEEWNKVSDGAPLVTGIVVVNSSAIENKKEAFSEFLEDYKASVEYVNSNVEEAAKLVGKHDIFKEEIAKAAIPYCNICFLDGDELEEKLTAYLNIGNEEENPLELSEDLFYKS